MVNKYVTGCGRERGRSGEEKAVKDGADVGGLLATLGHGDVWSWVSESVALPPAACASTRMSVTAVATEGCGDARVWAATCDHIVAQGPCHHGNLV